MRPPRPKCTTPIGEEGALRFAYAPYVAAFAIDNPRHCIQLIGGRSFARNVGTVMQPKSAKNSDLDFAVQLDADLDRLAALQPNWDAQGALPIDPRIIDAARHLVSSLPATSHRPPAIVPMADGSLQFEWNDGPRSLELEVESPHRIHYLKWHPTAGVEEEGVYDIQDVGRSVELIRWFHEGAAHA